MEAAMSEVTVSPEFQIVIPRSLREAMDIHQGQVVPLLADIALSAAKIGSEWNSQEQRIRR
jgi:bifunctional DNA-binding transcriptional regulator/antitoxin component of YhaV-PrlF toxin-antitoxin module